MGYETGLKAENHFQAKMHELGLQINYVDEWYDFEVENEKVEVKCTTFAVKDGKRKKKEKVRFGRFNLGCEENREKQRKENVWFCFIIRSFTQYMILGFARAEELKDKRHLPLGHLRRINLISLEEWTKQINKKTGE